MLNSEIIQIYGEESRGLLNQLISALGDKFAQICYVSTRGYVNVGAAMMPVTLVTKSEKINEIQDKLTDFRKVYPFMRVQQVKEIPDDYLCLYTSDTSSKITINPKLVELYGEESKDMLNKLIGYIDASVAPSVFVISEYGTQYVSTMNKSGTQFIDRVKIPKAVSTESAQVNYVENCINKFLSENCSKDSKVEIEVLTEMFVEGDIALCLQKNTHRIFDAANRMAGE